jgi:hypothetical protein
VVYLSGNLPELGPWDPKKLAMQGNGRERTALLRVPEGTALEFKFTLGAWEREGLGPSGTVMPNHRMERKALALGAAATGADHRCGVRRRPELLRPMEGWRTDLARAWHGHGRAGADAGL